MATEGFIFLFFPIVVQVKHWTRVGLPQQWLYASVVVPL